MKKLLALLLALALHTLSLAGTVTFTPDTTTSYANPERGFEFTNSGLGNCASMDLGNWAGDAAGLQTPIFIPTMTRTQTPLGTTVPTSGDMATWNTCFASVRAAGVMLGLRFLGTGTAAQAIAQAQAIATNGVLWNNRDVIAYIQFGWRCDFGEWADNCTDNNNVTDKTNTFNAIAAAMPVGIPLEFTQVYPRETWFGTTATTKAQAQQATFQGRIGFHSDCFMTGQGDSSFYPGTGTYTGFTSTQTASQQAAYVQTTSQWTSFGVETCESSVGAGVQMRQACSGATDAQGLSGGILNEGPRYGVTHINGGQAIGVGGAYLATWSSGGCLTTVTNFMGYRFQLDSFTSPSSVSRGGVATFDVYLRNVGWAIIQSQRKLHVQVKPSSGADIDCVSIMQLRELPRQASASTRVQVNCAIPGGTATGTAQLFIKGPSVFSTASANAYSIIFANTNSGGQQRDTTNERWNTGATMTIN